MCDFILVDDVDPFLGVVTAGEKKWLSKTDRKDVAEEIAIQMEVWQRQ